MLFHPLIPHIYTSQPPDTTTCLPPPGNPHICTLFPQLCSSSLQFRVLPDLICCPRLRRCLPSLRMTLIVLHSLIIQQPRIQLRPFLRSTLPKVSLPLAAYSSAVVLIGWFQDATQFRIKIGPPTKKKKVESPQIVRFAISSSVQDPYPRHLLAPRGESSSANGLPYPLEKPFSTDLIKCSGYNAKCTNLVPINGLKGCASCRAENGIRRKALGTKRTPKVETRLSRELAFVSEEEDVAVVVVMWFLVPQAA